MRTGLFFRIVYNSLYVFLCLLLFALLIVVPGDFTYQTLRVQRGQYSNLVIIAVVYVLTVLVVLFVYAVRLYVTRTVLASIPKAWIPVEKGDVTKEVRKLIVHDLGRSAAIAWAARPKIPERRAAEDPVQDLNEEADRVDNGTRQNGKEKESGVRKSLQLFRPKPPATVEDEMGIALPATNPVWGEIEHDGWGTPASPDLPDVQYSTVISELPNLIEAKAVSQAPPDPDATPAAGEQRSSAPGPDAVALLQIMPNMSLRDYITHLTTLGVLSASPTVAEFLDTYENARFSTRPVPSASFRRLMHLFADLLRAMRPLGYDIRRENTNDGASLMNSESDGHIDDDAPMDTTPTTPARSIASGSQSVAGSTSSVRRSAGRSDALRRRSSGNTWRQYRTAPTTPKSRNTERWTTNVSRSPSSNSSYSFAQTKLPFLLSQQTSSNSSTKSASRASTTGSVIRLATRAEVEDGELPYVLGVSNTA